MHNTGDSLSDGERMPNFRQISFLEGLTLLLLFFVAMPAKYMAGFPMAVTVVGWIHGILFIAYVASATAAASRFNWTSRFFYLVMIASLIPFGCFFLDRKLKQYYEPNKGEYSAEPAKS